jgi:hypothetical protein
MSSFVARGDVSASQANSIRQKKGFSMILLGNVKKEFR